MRVLFVSSNLFYPQLLTGAETSTHEACLQLAKHGLAPAVLAALKPRGMLTTSLRIRRHLFRDEYPADHQLGYPVFRVWQPLQALAPVAKKIGAEAIVITRNRLGLIEAALQTGLPCFIYLHSTDFVDPGLHAPAFHVANSAFTADRLKQQFGVDSVVIPPWINRERYVTATRPTSVLFVNPVRSKAWQPCLNWRV